MSVPAKPRVLLAEDHLVILEGFKAVLSGAGIDVVGEASDGRAAVSLCEKVRPDVVLIDIGMPVLNGIDAAREIRKYRPETQVVLLTMYSEDDYVLAGLRAGIRGYVLKSNAADRLLEAIRAVLAGEVYLSPEISSSAVRAYLEGSEHPVIPLSEREREVLALIAQGYTMKGIGDRLAISPRTAETYRARIQQKLEIRDLAGLVRYAIAHRVVEHAGPGPTQIESNNRAPTHRPRRRADPC